MASIKNSTKTATQVLREAVLFGLANIESYEPSTHVSYYYWNIGIDDIESMIDNFKVSMRTYLEKLEQNFEILDEVEFSEITPGPLYYLDTLNMPAVFSLFEYKLLMANNEILLQDVVNSLLTTVDSNALLSTDEFLN